MLWHGPSLSFEALILSVSSRALLGMHRLHCTHTHIHMQALQQRQDGSQDVYGTRPGAAFTSETTSQPSTASLTVQQSAIAKGADPLSQVQTALSSHIAKLRVSR